MGYNKWCLYQFDPRLDYIPGTSFLAVRDDGKGNLEVIHGGNDSIWSETESLRKYEAAIRDMIFLLGSRRVRRKRCRPLAIAVANQYWSGCQYDDVTRTMVAPLTLWMNPAKRNQIVSMLSFLLDDLSMSDVQQDEMEKNS